MKRTYVQLHACLSPDPNFSIVGGYLWVVDDDHSVQVLHYRRPARLEAADEWTAVIYQTMRRSQYEGHATVSLVSTDVFLPWPTHIDYV